MLTSAQRQWLQALGAGAALQAGKTSSDEAAGASAPTAAATAPALDKKPYVERVETARRNVFTAFDRYQEQKNVEAEQSVIAALSRAAKEVTTLGSFEDPGPALDRIRADFLACAQGTVAALQAGDAAAADAACAKLDALAARAAKLAYDYGEDVIDGAETAKTTVKVMDTGAKVVGGVALTLATGGAAAGVVAAEVVGTATAVSVAGGVAASTAGVATNLAIGQKVDWGMFSIDILIQALTARFGGELANGIAASVAKRLGPMAAKVGGIVIKNAATQIVLHVDTTLFKKALEVGYGKLVGQNLTLQEVVDSTIAQLTDVSSLLVIAATAAAQSHVDVKAVAASASSPKAAAAVPAVPAASTPAPEPQPPPRAPSEPPSSKPRSTAHAGGEGDAFRVELKPEGPRPEVVRVRRAARPKDASEPAAHESGRKQESPAEAAPADKPMIDPDDGRESRP